MISRPFASFDFTRFGQFTERSAGSAGTALDTCVVGVAITRPPFCLQPERERQWRDFPCADIFSPRFALVPGGLAKIHQGLNSQAAARRRKEKKTQESASIHISAYSRHSRLPALRSNPTAICF